MTVHTSRDGCNAAAVRVVAMETMHVDDVLRAVIDQKLPSRI